MFFFFGGGGILLIMEENGWQIWNHDEILIQKHRPIGLGCRLPMENIRCESKPNRQFIRPPNINTTSKEWFYRIQISGHGTNAYLLRVYLK